MYGIEENKVGLIMYAICYKCHKDLNKLRIYVTVQRWNQEIQVFMFVVIEWDRQRCYE